ncbi:protein kinase domain-containing protein [Sorangium sp. So ce233]|uniref:protein kinase domain-containing protein n=1 Tax=Sorangium sp. So ce233 TaxID=3133290 RepID=UPI003F5EA9C9
MRPGVTVADRFRIEGLAGSGGMGSVYRATDLTDDSAVALKVLHRGAEHQERRLEREARLLAELRHPGIVRHVAHGVTGDGQRYLALEWLDGEDLAARVARERLSVDGAVTLLRRLAGALGAVHARGIVHRDVTPGNIFLPGGALEAAKIVDFGIARAVASAGPDSVPGRLPARARSAGVLRSGERTGARNGVTLGTPGYMAPEQARGGALVDARADVFSLGCVIWHGLTGRPPFAGDQVMAILAKAALVGPPRLSELRPDVPAALDDLVAWMLEKEPDGRPRDGNEVLASAAELCAAREQARDAGDDAAASVRPARALAESVAVEQRLISVVLIHGALAGDAAAAAPASDTATGAPRAELPELAPEAAAPRAGPHEPTPRAATEAAIRAAVAPFGGRVDRLASTWLVVTLSGGEADPQAAPPRAAGAEPRTPTDEAARAARCALALRALLPADLSVALAMGQDAASGRWPARQVIERAAALLGARARGGPERAAGGARGGAPAHGGVLIDDVTAGLLALGRPEVERLHAELWAGRNAVEVGLDGLSRGAEGELVREVPGHDAAARARVDGGAAVRAFCLEELIRSIARGDAEASPETVLAMAHARLDDLHPAVRRILRAASIFGEAFWRGGLAALIGGAQGAPDLDRWLSELVARALVERRPACRFPGEEEYAFRHARLREAAYATLTRGDRLLGHRLAGAWLEQVGEPDALALAEHFDHGGEHGRAMRWFLRGAEQALARGDLAAAIALAERGARHGDLCDRLADADPDEDAGASAGPRSARGGETLGALRLVQAEAHRWRGELEQAQRCAAQAARRLPRGAPLWFRAADELMIASGRRGDTMLTTAWAKEVAACGDPAAEGPGDEGARRPEVRAGPPAAGVAAEPRAARVIALCSAARQLFPAGRYAEANALIARVRALAADLASLTPRVAAEVHRLRGARARHLGDPAGNLAGYAAAIDAFERAGDARDACSARVNLGFALLEVGDVERAGEELTAALEAAERMGLRAVATRARQNLGRVLAARGQLDEALALARQVILECRGQGNLRFEGGARVHAALIAHAAGDFRAAESDARGAAELLEVAPPSRAGALAALARALTAQGRVDEALAAAREASELLARHGGIEEFESLVLVAFVEAARSAGDLEGARAAAARARGRLLARAAAIPEPALRESFLHRVRENAMLLSLARICLGESAVVVAGRRASRP